MSVYPHDRMFIMLGCLYFEHLCKFVYNTCMRCYVYVYKYMYRCGYVCVFMCIDVCINICVH